MMIFEIVLEQSYHERWGLVMIGKDRLQITQDGESFETWDRGVPVFYEEGLGGFCQVAIDDDRIFVAGGWHGAEEGSGTARKSSNRYQNTVNIFFSPL